VVGARIEHGKDNKFFKSFLLLELLKGMSVTGRYFSRRTSPSSIRMKRHRRASASWPARAAPLRQRRRTLYRLQTVRSGMPGAGDQH